MPSQSTFKRYRGLSKAVTVHSYKDGVRYTTTLRGSRQAERLHKIQAQRALELSALAPNDQDATDRMFDDQDMDVRYDDPVPFTSQDSDCETDDEHDSGDLSGLAEHVSDWRLKDDRDRRDRIAIQFSQWEAQMPRLVDAYLDYRSRDLNDGFPVPEPNVANEEQSGTIHDIELIDLFVRRKATLVARAHHLFPNKNLISHGYIGCSPVYPNVALSLRTLAAFRQIHRTCPRFSIQAQCKVLCYLHQVPYRPYLFHQLSQAYDVYLDIIYRVQQRLQDALKRNSQEWRLLNECPACFYRLEDEPKLTFDWLVSIDGNNSLKRWDTSVYGALPRDDGRKPRSSYWLSNDEVNKFQYEVKATRVPRGGPDARIHDDDWEAIAESGRIDEFNCVDRWRNAKADVRKKTYTVFEESGIFLATCRHRFILLACDMVKSGELAKYPLAIISRLLDVYGPNGGCAYNIGCAFSKTVSASNLGPHMQELSLRFMVGAFHGHAHNRLCQLDWHLMYIEGVGNTEGEGCEHVFSASNELARSTRHATRFHRHQAIEEHIAFWNDDKYEALTRFIRNHYYREAAILVRNLSAELTFLKDKLHLNDADFPRFLAEERSYLISLKHPSPQDILKVRYVQALDELKERKIEWNTARDAVNGALSGVALRDLNAVGVAIRTARIHVDLAYTKLQNAETLAAHIQGQLGLESSWVIGDAEYNRFKEEASLGRYRAALGELERLVVMCLFELAKVSMSGTRYKLRQQISKSLQRRSEAIRKAITQYNTQAAQLVPPRRSISWKEIVEYTSLGEFDLLRHTRDDIRDRIWARPAVREATAKFFKLSRAKEEIARLNVEIQRLWTAIHDKEEELTETISSLRDTTPLLARKLERFSNARSAVNALHLYRLDVIEKQYGKARQVGIGTHAKEFHMTNFDPVEQASMDVPSGQSAPTTDNPIEEDAADEDQDERMGQDSPAFDELYSLYINEPGDDELIADEEDAAGVQAVAEFLQDIVD